MTDLYLIRNAIRDLTRPKKLLAALALIFAPGLLVYIMRFIKLGNGSGHGHGHTAFNAVDIYSLLSEKVVFGFVMVILALVFCTSVVAQEVENRTIVYLLTRPIPRFRILIVKFLPALAATLITVWLSLVFTAIAAYGFSGIVDSPLTRDLKMAPLGVLAYGSVFLLLTTLLNRPLIYGLLYAFGWETWVPNMPGSFQKLSLMAYLRVLTPHVTSEVQEVDISQAFSSVSQDNISHHMAWVVLAGTIVVSFVLSLYFFSVREYVPRDAE